MTFCAPRQGCKTSRLAAMPKPSRLRGRDLINDSIRPRHGQKA